MVDEVAVGTRGFEARSGTFDAVDVGGGAAMAAHDVMVVVAGARLEKCGATGRLDPASQTDVHECGEGVVDSLTRDRAQPAPCQLGDLFDAQVMALLAQQGEDRDALGGAPQARGPDIRLWVTPRRHIN